MSTLTPLQLINEWRRGCSNASVAHPEHCHECTVALIAAIEQSLADQNAAPELRFRTRHKPRPIAQVLRERTIFDLYEKGGLVKVRDVQPHELAEGVMLIAMYDHRSEHHLYTRVMP